VATEERKTSHVVTSSKVNGVSIVREGSNIHFVPSLANSTLTYDVISDDGGADSGQQSNCPYQSNISCGSLAGSGSGRNPVSGGGLKWTSRPQVSLTPTTTPDEVEDEEEEKCPKIDLILAAPTGYYGIKLDPLEAEDSTIRFLGANPLNFGGVNLDECLEESGEQGYMGIRRIERIAIYNLYSNGQPSRWAYTDGVRYHCIHEDGKVNLSAGMPMIGTYGTEAFYETSGTTDEGGLPHYGYQIDDNHNAIDAESFRAKVSGVAVPHDVAFFTRDALIYAVTDSDYNVWDSSGWDYPDYYGGANQKGPRIMEGIDAPRSCELTPEYTSEDAHVRIVEKINYLRYCVWGKDTIEPDSNAGVAAQVYSDRMAELLFVQEDDPLTGSTPLDRLVATGVSVDDVVVLYQLEAAIPDPTLPDELPEGYNDFDALRFDMACDNLFAKFTENQESESYLSLISNSYFKVGAGIAQEDAEEDEETGLGGDWYGCIVLWAHVEDEPDVRTSVRLQLKDAPNIEHTDYELLYPYVWHRGTGYRAFAQAPREEIGISCMCRQTFSAEMGGILEGNYVRIKDYKAYEIVQNSLARDGEGNILPIDAEPNEINDSTGHTLFTTGGWLRIADDDGRDGTVYNEFHLQRDDLQVETTGEHTLKQTTQKKDIYVRLHNVWNQPQPTTSTDSDDSHFFRSSPLLDPGSEPGELPYRAPEEEPTLEAALNDYGNTKLYVGTTLVDEARRFPQGRTLNPWQNIFVGSIFHTVSGYTAITYTMPKMLRMTHRYWVTGQWQKELYWWFKQSYWAAVLDPDGTILHRWPLTAPPHDFSDTEEDYLSTEKSQYVAESTTDFSFQFDGLIREGSVSVNCYIGGNAFTLFEKADEETERFDGTLYEMPDQLASDQYDEDENGDPLPVCTASDISYKTGLVTFSFGGTPKPKVYNTLYITAEIADVDWHSPIETWTEVVRYETDDYNWRPYQISFAGYQPLTPNLTITEDGKYAVFTCKIAGATCAHKARLRYGQIQTSYDEFASAGYTLGSGKMQCQVFDLEEYDDLLEGPKRVTEPLFLNETYGDTVILN